MARASPMIALLYVALFCKKHFLTDGAPEPKLTCRNDVILVLQCCLLYCICLVLCNSVPDAVALSGLPKKKAVFGSGMELFK